MPGVVKVMICVSTPSLLEHVLAIRDVAVAAHRDVVVARIVETRIALGVDRELDGAVAGLERVEVFGRIEVVVDVNQHVVEFARVEDLRKPDKVDGQPGGNEEEARPRISAASVTDLVARRCKPDARMKTIGTAGIAPHAIRGLRSCRARADETARPPSSAKKIHSV